MSFTTMEFLLNTALSEHNVPHVSLGKAGFASTRIGGVAVNFEYVEDAGLLYVYSSLGLLQQDLPAVFYEAVLEANLLGVGTRGGHIGLHASTRILMYSLCINETALESREVANALNLYAETALLWMQKVQDILQDAGQAPDIPLVPGPVLGGILWG